MLSLSFLSTRIREAVNRLVRERADSAEIERAIDEIIMQAGFAGPGRPQAVEDLVTEGKKQSEWLKGAVVSDLAREGLASTLRLAGNEFARMGDSIREDVVRLVSDGLASDRSSRSITDELELRLGKARHVAETVVRTGTAAFDRIGRIADANAAGAQLYRYAGPSAERAFCRDLLAKSKAGKRWTIDEIRAMSNGQGMNVLYHCGGYRCRHDWEPDFTAKPTKRQDGSSHGTYPDAAPRDVRIARLREIRTEMTNRGKSDRRVKPVGNSPVMSLVPDTSPGRGLPSTKAIREVEHSLRVINRVHGTGDLVMPQMEVGRVLQSGMTGRYVASFTERKAPGGRLMITSATPRIEVSDYHRTAIPHEFGHAIDDLLIGERRTWASISSPLLSDWREAVRSSRRMKEWEFARDNPVLSYNLLGGEQRSKLTAQMNYMIDPRELWARSYAQYIVRRSGDPSMRRMLQRWDARNSWRWHWDDDDFDDIFGTIDDLFLKLGWIE